jgi:hypothetical protein
MNNSVSIGSLKQVLNLCTACFMNTWRYIFLVSVLQLGIYIPGSGNPYNQTWKDSLETSHFRKKETNTGFFLFRNNSRESLTTGFSEYSEERSNYALYGYFGVHSWRFMDLLQEEIHVSTGIGPLYSTGESERSTATVATRLDNRIYGISTFADLQYEGRFYYDATRYALVEVLGYGRFETLKMDSEGTIRETGKGSSQTPVTSESTDNRLRYGADARAGVGFGRLEPVNYRMQAEYLLETFYSGKLFSAEETNRVISAISKIKNNRKWKEGHVLENERNELLAFLREKMLLLLPDIREGIWQFSEFKPRFSGKRFEAGPLFSYYNREPDFIYGGFARVEFHSYRSTSRNVRLLTEVTYNRYKERDWFLWENAFQLDYYQNLRSLFSVGVKYVPGMVVNGFTDVEPVQHALIPYLEYYRQLNEKYRMMVILRYRITEENDFFMKGPEFSLAFYRSRY